MTSIAALINQLPIADKAALDNIIVEKQINSKEEVLFSTSLNQVAIYVVKGSLRKYVIKEGKEKTIDFYFTDDIYFAPTTQYQSIFPMYIKAIEPSVAFIVHLTSFEQIKKQHRDLIGLEYKILEMAHEQIAYRLETFQLFNATERYLDLLKRSPQILQHVQLTHIASYLGINNASLSKIRASLR